MLQSQEKANKIPHEILQLVVLICQNAVSLQFLPNQNKHLVSKSIKKAKICMPTEESKSQPIVFGPKPFTL